MGTKMDSRIYLATLSLFVIFLSSNAAPIHSEVTEDFPSDRECFYQTQYYPHGTSIETEEPCLNCTCNKGVLVCFLRVCHNLVAPQDSDCEVRKSEGQCCAELVCGVKTTNATQNADVTTPTPRLSDLPLESTSWRTSSERSSEDTTLSPTDFKVQDNAVKSGCRQNGSIYAEGSAMPSSAFCEYCYCIKGNQRCIRPQCHLHIDECKPIYRHDFSCCPTAYACSKRTSDFTSTPSPTTAASVLARKRQDCHVNGTSHREGDVVFNEDVCQNCFCVKGEVRCSTTTCALKLEGCEPIIQPGKCCPTGYNCASQSTTDASEELDSSNTEGITSYFDNVISSTDSSFSETQEAEYEARTANDTLLINDTGPGNGTIATRDNDRNILEAEASVSTTVSTEDALSNAPEIASATPGSTEGNIFGETTVGNAEADSVDSENNVEVTSNLPADTEDSSTPSPTSEAEQAVSNATEDIAEGRTQSADAANVSTALLESSQTLNSSAEEAGDSFNDTTLQSKAAATDAIELAVNETITETKATGTNAFQNASEVNGSLPEDNTNSLPVVNVTDITPLSDDANATISVDVRDAAAASDNNSSGNGTTDVAIDATHANETNDILEERHDIDISTIETKVLEENLTDLNDSIVVERTDVDKNANDKIIVPNALYGGTEEGNNSHANASEIIYRHNVNSTTNITGGDADIQQVATNGTEEYPTNGTSVDIQQDDKKPTEITPRPHHLQNAGESAEQQGSKLANLTEIIKEDNAEDNQTAITNYSDINNSTVNATLSTSENEAESLNDMTHLNLNYKSPLGTFDNSTSSPYIDAEESNTTTEHVDNVADKAIYRQAVKSNASISSFEDEGIPNLHFSKTTPKENFNHEHSINVTEASSDQLQDPYVAHASNETLIIKPGPAPPNNTNTLLGSFSSIVSSLLKRGDNESSTTAQTTKETELVTSSLPEGFDVLLEDLVGEYPGEVQFNTISYLNFNNDVATVSTTAVTRYSITHTPELEATPSDEAQLVGEDEATTEANNRIEDMSNILLKNLTAEGNLTVAELDENNNKTIENLNITTNTSQQSGGQEEDQLPLSEQKNQTAVETENHTTQSLSDVHPEIKSNETEIQPTGYSHLVTEETTSEEIALTSPQSDQTSESDVEKPVSQVTRIDYDATEEAVTEKELNISTTSAPLNTTSSIDSSDEVDIQNVLNANASEGQSDIRPTAAPTSTALNSNTAQETTTQIISYSDPPTLLHAGNESLQAANDSITDDDHSNTSSPLHAEDDGESALGSSMSTTHQPHQYGVLTTVNIPDEFFYHSDNSDAGIDGNSTLPEASEAPEYGHNITESNQPSLETSTIVEDLDDTLEMILNLSKTYSLIHPRPPAFDKSQNKTDEELLSGTLPSEVEAKIAEIIRQAQAGLMSGAVPSPLVNLTLPHFTFGENEHSNTTSELSKNETLPSLSSDYEYDDPDAAQPIPPNGLLEHLGSLFNSSWTSQISGDVHRDSFHELPEASEDPPNSPPSNESIMHDLHQMFIPLVSLTDSVHATEAAPTASPALASTTLSPRESPEEVITQNDTRPSDEEQVGADGAHRPLAPTESAVHSIEHQTEAHTTEAIVHGDQWQNHGENQDEGGHFAHENDENHQSFEGVQGHSDNEDVFSHAVAADDDEKSYFSADDFETGANRHEVENSGEVSAADSKIGADEVGAKEDPEHNDALLETTHLAHEPDPIADWQNQQDKPVEQLEYGDSQSELLEAVPQTTAESSPATTTTEVPHRSTGTTSSGSHAVDAQPQEEAEVPVTFPVEESPTTEAVSEVRNAEAMTEAATTPASPEVQDAETTTATATVRAAAITQATAEAKAEVTTPAFTTNAIHGVDNTEAAETEAPHKHEDESATGDAWFDQGDDSNADPTEGSTVEYLSTTARNVPKDHATNFFSTLSNFFSQAIANAGLRQPSNERPQNKPDGTGVSESDDNRSGFGVTHDDRHRVTALDATKSEENPDFPEAGFLLKDAASSGHHSLVTEVTSADHGNAQPHHPINEPLPQTASVLLQQPSESSPVLHVFDNDQQHGDSGEHVKSAFVASEVITTPDPNAFVGLVSKGSIVFENVLPLSRRGRPTTDEKTGHALPTPRKSSGIDSESTEESALAPEDVRVIPFLPEDAITDELHKDPVKPNLAPRNEDKEAVPAHEELELITRTPLVQDGSMAVRVSATSTFQVEDVAGHDETGSVGVAVPLSPEGDELAPITDATQRTSTSSVTTDAFPDLQDGTAAPTTIMPPAEATKATTVSSTTTQQAEPTSTTAIPTLSSADTIDKAADPHLEHPATEATHELTPRTQSTRTNKNDDQGVFNMQSAPNFQQTPDYCVEEGEVFQDGERIPTSDFCAQCRCNRGEIQCQHVSCPQRPPGCIEKVMPSSCCPAFLCNETGLIQDGESGLPMRSGITIHGGFVPIERPVIPPEHHGSAFEGTRSHAEVPSADETHGPEHSQPSMETEVTDASGHIFGDEVDGHETAPAEQTVAPRTPEPQQDPLPSSVNEGPSRDPTTESSGIFGGLLESIFGGDKTEGPPAGLGDEVADPEDPETSEHNPELPETERTHHTQEDVQPPTTTLRTTSMKPSSRRTTATSPPTEGTTKASEAPAGLWPMLKVSSCNIYGRVYQVGSKIGVLSGPCKECKCTSGGVECYRIKCF